MTTLACNASVQRMRFKKRQAVVFMEAMHLIVRDGMNPLAVHLALLQIDEYRAGCAQDMLGIAKARARFDGAA